MWGSKLYMNMKHLTTHEQEINEERGAQSLAAFLDSPWGESKNIAK